MKITQVTHDIWYKHVSILVMHEGENYRINFDYNKGKDTVDVHQVNKRGNPIPIADLIAFAKAGGKVSEVKRATADHTLNYNYILEKYDICTGSVCDFIKGLIAERDALKAEVAKLTRGKVVVAKRDIRCIDCGHLDLGTLQNGHAECGDTGTHIMIDVYRLDYCHHFTPAAEGCGSVDQALQAELARVTEEGGK